jgi:7,8-dihydroneopterin aldolase/epimerase/oxygenase
MSNRLTISIEQLRLSASIGILEHELRAKQPLVVSIRVHLRDAPLAPTRDDVSEVLDYRWLRQVALDVASQGHINMLETFAGRIAQTLVSRPAIAEVIVRVEKPNVFPDCDGASVELHHSK